GELAGMRSDIDIARAAGELVGRHRNSLPGRISGIGLSVEKLREGGLVGGAEQRRILPNEGGECERTAAVGGFGQGSTGKTQRCRNEDKYAQIHCRISLAVIPRAFTLSQQRSRWPMRFPDATPGGSSIQKEKCHEETHRSRSRRGPQPCLRCARHCRRQDANDQGRM